MKKKTVTIAIKVLSSITAVLGIYVVSPPPQPPKDYTRYLFDTTGNWVWSLGGFEGEDTAFMLIAAEYGQN